MSITLLHPAALALTQSRLVEIDETLREAERLLSLGFAERFLRKVPDDLNDKVDLIRQTRNAYYTVLTSPAWSVSEKEPISVKFPSRSGTEDLFRRIVYGHLFLYKNAFYCVDGPYNEDEACLLLLDSIKRKRRKVEYLVAREDVQEGEQGYERLPIPEDVRHEVWRRDRGRCCRCGSVHNLEFDHQIPVSKGGSNTARNIQLLCEPCNRRKSDNIG